MAVPEVLKIPPGRAPASLVPLTAREVRGTVRAVRKLLALVSLLLAGLSVPAQASDVPVAVVDLDETPPESAPHAVDDTGITLERNSTMVQIDILSNDVPSTGITINYYEQPPAESGVTFVVVDDTKLYASVSETAPLADYVTSYNTVDAEGDQSVDAQVSFEVISKFVPPIPVVPAPVTKADDFRASRLLRPYETFKLDLTINDSDKEGRPLSVESCTTPRADTREYGNTEVGIVRLAGGSVVVKEDFASRRDFSWRSDYEASMSCVITNGETASRPTPVYYNVTGFEEMNLKRTAKPMQFRVTNTDVEVGFASYKKARSSMAWSPLVRVDSQKSIIVRTKSKINMVRWYIRHAGKTTLVDVGGIEVKGK